MNKRHEKQKRHSRESGNPVPHVSAAHESLGLQAQCSWIPDHGFAVSGMTWVKNIRFFLIPVFCLLLSGCGFHSVYGRVSDDGVAVSDQMSLVAIDPIPEKAGQELRNYLLDRFNADGRPASPAYRLKIKLRMVEEDLGTLANGTSTLSDIRAFGDYTFVDRNGAILATGTTSSTAQYDKLADMYGTQAAHDSAIDRAMRELSEQLTARIGLYFADPSPSPVVPPTPVKQAP